MHTPQSNPSLKFSPDHQTVTVKSHIDPQELGNLIRNHNPRRIVFQGSPNAAQREILNQARKGGINIR